MRVEAFLLVVAANLVSAIPLEERAAPTTGGTGPYKPASWTTDSTLTQHTIYQPSTAPNNTKLPVLIWSNGACTLDGTSMAAFLLQVASHGIFAIANGAPGGSGGGSDTSSYMTSAMNWITSNAGKGKYTHVDASRMAAAGMSCGGLDTYAVKDDSRVSALGIFNSGYIDESKSKTEVPKIKKPIFYFLGGSTDIAYANGERDYTLLPSTTPTFKGNIPTGHGSTFGEKDAGRVGIAGSRWAEWLLRGNTTAATWFTGNGAKADGWDTVSRNLDKISVTPI